MKFGLKNEMLMFYIQILILVQLLIGCQSIKLENLNTSLNSEKNTKDLLNLVTNKSLMKYQLDNTLYKSKEKLLLIKNQILNNLNEFEKLNKIIIEIEDVEKKNNSTKNNSNETEIKNKTEVQTINKNCNLDKLKKKSLKDKNIPDERKSNSTNETLSDLNSTNKTILNKTDDNSSHNNSITSDDLLNLIADQTESIKNEICTNCLEINSALNVLIEEIKNIKVQLKKFTTEKLTKKDAYEKLSYCINNINLIKADLFKLNEILDTLQKANCDNFVDNSKKYTLVVNSTNRLVEIIQNVLRKLKININLVVLN